MPLVMMEMLGGSLSQNMAGGLGFNYGQFMMIGMVVNRPVLKPQFKVINPADQRNTQ